MMRTVAALCLMWCATSAQAVNIPSHIQDEISNARLAGQGTYRWFGLKIYHAALWVGDQGYLPEEPASTKFALNLTYARNLYGERIAQSSIDEISQLGYGSSAQHEVWLNKMKTLFPDVQEGMHISGVHIPGQGARFYLNGKLLGEIADTDFARAFFAIWLDPRTSASKLRGQLLSASP